MKFVIFMALVIGSILYITWYKPASAKQKKAIRNQTLIVGGIALLIMLALTGRLNPLIALIGAAVPLVMRVLSLVGFAKRASGMFNQFKGDSDDEPQTGQHSEVSTAFLHVSLDHNSGEIDGEILQGQFRGRQLKSLSFEEAVALYAHCANMDHDSARILETFMERRFGEDWHTKASAGRAGDEEMTESEARAILGVEADATRDEIVSAHRRIIQKVHPDRGGSSYLATQLNRAKARLLGG